jgi:hypothetical protein
LASATGWLDVPIDRIPERLKVENLMAIAVFGDVDTAAGDDVAIGNPSVAVHPASTEKDYPKIEWITFPVHGFLSV